MTLSEHVYDILSSHGDPAIAQPMAKYMKHRFAFFGIQSTRRKALVTELVKESSRIPLSNFMREVKALWTYEERECQYVGLDMMIRNKKRIPIQNIEEVEWLIINRSWWDTVDALASHVIGEMFSYPSALRAEYLDRWLTIDNIWLNRTCLLYQLKYRQSTDFDALSRYIGALKHKEEFFIQKAIGWSLRQYSKSDPARVRDYIQSDQFSALVMREASKYI